MGPSRIQRRRNVRYFGKWLRFRCVQFGQSERFCKRVYNTLSDGRIEDNLDSFSKETQTLFKEWKKGKKTSKDVFESVIKDLNNTTNEQEALSIASNVWSALGEDNAMKVIKSLTKANDKYKDTKGTEWRRLIKSNMMTSGNSLKLSDGSCKMNC